MAGEVGGPLCSNFKDQSRLPRELGNCWKVLSRGMLKLDSKRTLILKKYFLGHCIFVLNFLGALKFHFNMI